MQRIYKLYCVVLVLVFSVFLTGCTESEEVGVQEISIEELDKEGVSGEKETEEPEKIFVHICGEVKHPGVYELTAGSRVYEAIEAAGGLTEAAAADSVNQAGILNDGQQIEFLSVDEQQKQNNSDQHKEAGKVNINEASREELMTLPGIGEAKADAIIRHREENGKFQSIEALMEIEGIKEGVFRKIESRITAL